ncbi:MAG: sigma-70 family RNA polymerase sigma factor [Coleofasciculus sp. B1-GNL1-01]|uniref:sigma-70 family RNA polymerase sigma factor n=1 Tax=Coleofasciculus sp. B1-GNL1-01 TaxID=3068484 RepID=UPI0032FF5182
MVGNQQLNKELRQLAIKAQQHPANTKMRQIALTRLVNAIQRSGKLCRPYSGQFSGLYEDIYSSACNRTFLYICQNIDSYNQNRGEVIAWVNFIMKRRFIDAINETFSSFVKPSNCRNKRLGAENLEQLVTSDLNPFLSSEIIFWIKEDPDGLFQATHISNHTEVNFQYLVIKRIEGYSWRELSEHLKIPLSTLSRFYDRCLTRFSSHLREYLY